MSAAGKASETPVPNPEHAGDSHSSPVTDSPEATIIEGEMQAEAENKGGSKLRHGPRRSYRATSSSIGHPEAIKMEQHPSADAIEYHGHQDPEIAMTERKEKRHKHKKPRTGNHSTSSHPPNAAMQASEHSPEMGLQERASKDTSVELPTWPSTMGMTDSLLDSQFAKQTRALRSSLSGSVQTTDFHLGDDPDSLGGFNRSRGNMLLIDTVAKPDKLTKSGMPPSRTRLTEVKDIGTSSFYPDSAANSQTYKMQYNGLPESAVEGVAYPRQKLESAFAICALSVAALMGILLLMVVMLAVKVEECDRQLQLAREPIVDKACFNPACEMVVTLMNKWQNPNVEPCNAFHAHVCGRWHRIGIERPSHATENRNNFLIRVGLSLERVANYTSEANSSMHHMAFFYKSCRRFAVERGIVSARDALRLTGIDFRAWLAPSLFQELFPVIVAECLRTGLTSVISVKLRDQQVYIDIGSTLANFLPNQTHRLASVIEATVSEFQVPRNPSLIPALIALDSRLQLALAMPSPPTKFRLVAVRHLATQSLVEAWVQGLNRGLNNIMTVDSNTLVRARHLTQISDLIGILSSVEALLANIYSLMLPIAQVMQFGAFGPFNIGGGRENNSVPADRCLRETAEHFPMELTVWVKKAMESPEARSYFESMMATFEQVISELPSSVKGLAFNASDIAKLRNKRSFMPHEAPPREVPPMDRDNFLLNMIALSGQVHDESGSASAQLLQQQLTGDLGVFAGESMVIPTLQLTDDVMHAETTDPMLDYSTVGVRVLVEWAHIVLDQNPALRSRLVEIVRNRTISRVPFEDLPKDNLRWMLLPWALDVALIAARMRSPMSPDKATEAHRDQLFFRRFCQAGCGDAQGAQLCSYGTRHSTFFAQAFECTFEGSD